MRPTRRDVIMLGAGVTVGLPFTPVPWKMLDDSAIWTQNWPWIPTPARRRGLHEVHGLHAVPGRLRFENTLHCGQARGDRTVAPAPRQWRRFVRSGLRRAPVTVASATGYPAEPEWQGCQHGSVAGRGF